jgi:hypothetical protein
VRRLLLSLAIAGLGLVAVASAAWAGVGYSVIVDSPRGIARGAVAVRAHVTGGVGDAQYAAYQAAGGAWETMQPSGSGRFESAAPWDTDAIPNGDYDVEVRVWGDVPPYQPDEQRTYARQVVTISVDNAPPGPTGLHAAAGRSGIRLSWSAVPTADRGDFQGYQVLSKAGASCGGSSAYRQAGQLSATSFSLTGLSPGTYCFRVVALRSSTVSGTVASAPSAVASAVVGEGSRGHGRVPDAFDGSGGSSGGEKASPPDAPALGEGDLQVSDGEYDPSLPYGPQTITQQVDGRAVPGFPVAEEEPGVGPRRAVSFVAAGLILAVGALLLRRFLASAPDR